jgi:hypothetical protein
LKGNLKIASLYQGINDALQCRLASVWVANLSDDLQGTKALAKLSVLQSLAPKSFVVQSWAWLEEIDPDESRCRYRQK